MGYRNKIKTVKIRYDNICSRCFKKLPKGTKAICQTWFSEYGISNAWLCQKCYKKIIKHDLREQGKWEQ